MIRLVLLKFILWLLQLFTYGRFRPRISLLIDRVTKALEDRAE